MTPRSEILEWLSILFAASYSVPTIVAASKGYPILAIGWGLQAIVGTLVRLLWLPDTFNSPIFTRIRKHRDNILVVDKILLFVNIINLLRQANSSATLSEEFILTTTFIILMKIAQIKILPVGCKYETCRQLLDVSWLGGGMLLVSYCIMKTLK